MAMAAPAGGDEKLMRSFHKLIKTRLLKKEIKGKTNLGTNQTTDGKDRQLPRQLLLRNSCAGGGAVLEPNMEDNCTERAQKYLD